MDTLGEPRVCGSRLPEAFLVWPALKDWVLIGSRLTEAIGEPMLCDWSLAEAFPLPCSCGGAVVARDRATADVKANSATAPAMAGHGLRGVGGPGRAVVCCLFRGLLP